MGPFKAIVDLVTLIPASQRRAPALIGMAIIGVTVISGAVATLLGPVTKLIEAIAG